MNFTADKEALINAIRTVSGAVDEKQKNMPSLAFVKFSLENNTLSLTGYDLELGIETSIPVQSLDSGEFLCERKLADLIAKLPNGDIEFTAEDDVLTVKVGRSKNKRPVLSASDYPLVSVSGASAGTGTMSVSQETLKNMILQTIFAVAVSENKPVLTGELFEVENGVFNIVAIDGYRLALRTEKTSNSDVQFVVPAKALKEISKLLGADGEVKITSTGKHAIFEFNNIKVFTRLLEGQFHDYKKTVQGKGDSIAKVNTRELISCLERCLLIVNDKSKAPVKCSFGNGELHLMCKTDVGEVDEIIPTDFTGEIVEIGFNVRYLLDCVKNTQTDEAVIYLGNALSPAIITSISGDMFTFLVLPVRLRQ